MSVHHAVFDRARRHPDDTAVVDADGTRTSYCDLARMTSHLAAVLAGHAEPGQRVGIVTVKSSTTITAMLAVLAAGMAYVPLDPGAPDQRRRYVQHDAGCAIVLSRTEVDVPAGCRFLDLTAHLAPAAWRERSIDEHFGTPVRPDDEAYVLYTSGSTGTPKGVVITHRNASAFVDWAGAAFPLGPGDQVAVHAPLHFDLPVYDVYAGLAAGATLHPVPERAALFPEGLHRFLRERAITHLYAVPSALTALVNRSALRPGGLPALRQVLHAGEAFHPRPLAALMAAAPHATVANLYGPIETNVITSHRVTAAPDPDERVPIGTPLPGVELALLGEDGSLSLRGAADGEIVVSGDCVTPGYLGRADLNRDSFLHTADGRRFYRTGDFARRGPDGVLHLRGRRDGLVKTRGYRVELGEVETTIAAHPDVAEAAVVVEPDPEITHRLHAFVSPARRRDGIGETPADRLADAVIEHCRHRLAAYMVPQTVRVVLDFPRTSTGKIARNELVVRSADRPAVRP